MQTDKGMPNGQADEAPAMAPSSARDPDRLFVAAVAMAVVIATTAPYVYEGAQSHGRWFTGAQFSATDYRWYLMWISMARDGWIRSPHLYQGVDPLGAVINPVYLVAGRIAALLRLSLPTAYQAARIALCSAFVGACWPLLRTLLTDRGTQRLALLLICFSSGLGWIRSLDVSRTSIDLWQPEAITFLTLYLYPHFIFANIMQVLFFASFVEAERTGRRAPIAGACVSVAALSFVHPYDLVSLATVVAVYMALGRAAIRSHAGPPVRRTVLHALAAGVAALPGAIYFVVLYRRDTHNGVQPPPTPSPHLYSIVQGYGLILVLVLTALIAFAQDMRATQSATDVRDRAAAALGRLGLRDGIGATMLVAWIIGTAISMAYPVGFQRKLIEGVHIPLAILAAVGTASLLLRRDSASAADSSAIRVIMVLLILSISNLHFVTRDVQWNLNNYIYGYRSYLLPGEVTALEWTHDHTPASCTVQPIPWMTEQGGVWKPSDSTLLLYAPALSLRHENCGETFDPGNAKKIANLVSAVSDQPGGPDKQKLLNDAPIDYVVFSQKNDPAGSVDKLFPELLGKAPLPSYLHLVYSNRDADVYRVDSNRPS